MEDLVCWFNGGFRGGDELKEKKKFGVKKEKIDVNKEIDAKKKIEEEVK